MNQNLFDLIIIGSGPAGLTASIYASRYKMSNLVLGKQKAGTIGFAHRVENWPGFTAISGLELMEKVEAQAKALGAEIIYDPVRQIKKENGFFSLFTDSGKNYQTKTLILATGTERRKLGISGEEKFLGKGVSYCTVCDIPFFKDKTIVLVGGADAACSGAVHAAEYAAKVYLIYRKEQLRAEPVWIDQVSKNPKIEVIYNTNISKILGGEDIKILGEKEKNSLQVPVSEPSQIAMDKVAAVELDPAYKGSNFLKTDGIFIEIGGVPGTTLAQLAGIELDEAGFIKVDKEMKTNIQGIFAAGDTTDFLPRFQQMITASAMGAIAAASAYQYLKGNQAPPQRGI